MSPNTPEVAPRATDFFARSDSQYAMHRPIAARLTRLSVPVTMRT